MSKLIGRLVNLGIGKEAVRGAGVAPAMWLPHVDFSVAEKADIVRDTSGFSNIADSQDIAVSEKYAEGEISGPLRDQTIGYFLYNILGACVSSASGTGYSHAFSLTQANNHQSLALVKKDDIQTVMYKLAMLNKLDLKVALDSYATFTAGIIAKVGSASSATAAYTAENRFTKKHCSVKVAATTGDLAAATALDLKTLDLSIEKNVIRDSAFGTVQPVDILNKSISISGSFSLNYEDNTFRDYFLAGTKKALQIVLSNTDVDLGSGLRPSLTIVLPSVDFEWSPNYALEDIISQTLNFKANYSLATSQQIISTCTLVNGKATY
jgi:hypothetical protein